MLRFVFLLFFPCAVFAQAFPHPTLWRLYPVENFGADSTGTNDATAAFSAALSAASAAGNGTVLACGRYSITSGNVVIPQGVSLVGCTGTYPGNTVQNRNFNSTNSTLLVSASYTVQVGTNSRLSNMYVQRFGMGYPTSFRSLVSATANFSGVGVTLGDGVTTDSGSDSVIEDVSILGFAVGISANQQSRFKINLVAIDAVNCINVNNMFDVSWISNVECYPFTTYNTAWAQAQWPVTGLTSSGNVAVLTLGSPTVSSATLLTGDKVNVYGLTGLSGLTGTYTLSVNGSNYTLTGSVVSPSVTANTVSGSTLVTVTGSMTGIGVGQVVSGTGITGSPTVASVNPRANLVTLSAAATSTQTASTLTFTSPAYSSGGTVRFTEIRRYGDGFTAANSAGLIVNSMFVLGHDIGFHTQSGAQGTIFTSCRTDYESSLQEPTSVSYQEDGTSVWSIFTGGSLGSENTAVVINRQNGAFLAPSTFTGMNLTAYASGYLIWANWGRVAAVNSANTGSPGKFYVSDNLSSMLLVGMDLQGTPAIEVQSASDYQKVTLAGAQVSLPTLAVTNLPACGSTNIGQHWYVNNATQTLTAGVGAIVAAGGANIVPVGCDGTNWRIGG